MAVGGNKGDVKIIDEETLQTLVTLKSGHGCVSDIKYSPDNAYLAVASHDTCVDIYSVAKVGLGFSV